jgi:putative intracellular protease/amidase
VKEVLLVLTDRWADWEASFAVAEINSAPEYEVKTIAADQLPKVSIGGIRAEIDYRVQEYRHFDKLAMILLPGGYSWKEDCHKEIADFVRKVSASHIPVAAICGATIFLGKHGFLDKVKHTGDLLELFEKEQGYHGQDFYVPAQVVVDKGFITANETAAVEFAYEIFKVLKIDEAEEIERWRDYYKNGAVR